MVMDPGQIPPELMALIQQIIQGGGGGGPLSGGGAAPPPGVGGGGGALAGVLSGGGGGPGPSPDGGLPVPSMMGAGPEMPNKEVLLALLSQVEAGKQQQYLRQRQAGTDRRITSARSMARARGDDPASMISSINDRAATLDQAQGVPLDYAGQSADIEQGRFENEMKLTGEQRTAELHPGEMERQEVEVDQLQENLALFRETADPARRAAMAEALIKEIRGEVAEGTRDTEIDQAKADLAETRGSTDYRDVVKQHQEAMSPLLQSLTQAKTSREQAMADSGGYRRTPEDPAKDAVDAIEAATRAMGTIPMEMKWMENPHLKDVATADLALLLYEGSDMNEMMQRLPAVRGVLLAQEAVKSSGSVDPRVVMQAVQDSDERWESIPQAQRDDILRAVQSYLQWQQVSNSFLGGMGQGVPELNVGKKK